MKKLTTTVLLFATAAFSSCTKVDDSLAVKDLVTVSDRVDREIAIVNENTVRVRNAIGSVIVDWGGDTSKVRWFMNRQVTGERESESRAQLSSIQLERQLNGDTVNFVSQYPLDMSKFSYATLVSLGIPYYMKTFVDGSGGSTLISNLGGDVVVRNAHGIKIINLNGSCDLSSSDGGDTVNISIPAGGFCFVTKARGKILLRIPVNTSATVSARATNGTVSHSSLTFSDLVQNADSLSGKLGAGYGQIRLRTGDGSIVIQGL